MLQHEPRELWVTQRNGSAIYEESLPTNGQHHVRKKLGNNLYIPPSNSELPTQDGRPRHELCYSTRL